MDTALLPIDLDKENSRDCLAKAKPAAPGRVDGEIVCSFCDHGRWFQWEWVTSRHKTDWYPKGELNMPAYVNFQCQRCGLFRVGFPRGRAVSTCYCPMCGQTVTGGEGNLEVF